MIFQVGPGDKARHCTQKKEHSCGKTFMYFCIIVPAQHREKQGYSIIYKYIQGY